MLIKVPEIAFTMKGSCRVISRCTFSKRILDIQEAQNTLFSAYKNAVVKDLAYDLRTSTPKVMAFSRDVVVGTPTELTNEFRAGLSRFADENRFQIVSVLGSTEGNNGGGNIKSIGFYMGDDATMTVGTGTLCSLINTLNVAKTSAIEITFQYQIEFS